MTNECKEWTDAMRAKAIDLLVEDNYEAFQDHDVIVDTLRSGCIGFNDMSNEELAKMLAESGLSEGV